MIDIVFFFFFLYFSAYRKKWEEGKADLRLFLICASKWFLFSLMFWSIRFLNVVFHMRNQNYSLMIAICATYNCWIVFVIDQIIR